jgi:glycosyltransferase involved in cell wall biosynthesis
LRETLILGYAPQLKGGVTGVTKSLVARLRSARILPILGFYGQPVRSAGYTLRALAVFVGNVMSRRVASVIVLVGSRGDAIRTLPFLVVCCIARCPFLLQFHKDLVTVLGGRPIAWRLATALWNRAHELVFLSSRLAEEGRKDFGLNPASCRVIPNGLEPGWLGLERKPLACRHKDAVFIGRWQAEKGVDDLTAVFAPDWLGQRLTCHAYGSAPGQSVEANILFHGWCTPDELAEALSDAKLLVLPSRAEAYPTVLLEAAAAGTPFVATSIAGIPDIVEQSGGGRCFRPGNRQSMASAIEGLLSDSRAWETASLAAHAWAQQQSAARYAEQWQRLLDETSVRGKGSRAN